MIDMDPTRLSSGPRSLRTASNNQQVDRTTRISPSTRTKMGSRTRSNAKRRCASKQQQTLVVDIDEDTASDSTQVLSDEPENFEVEKVVGKQIDADGNIFYLLKWKSWNGEPTWEPQENCGCIKLIADFEEMVAKRQGKAKTKGDSPANNKTPPRKSLITKTKSLKIGAVPAAKIRRNSRRNI